MAPTSVATSAIPALDAAAVPAPFRHLRTKTSDPMAHRNSERAKEHEREVVHAAEAKGLEAERAWNSDGRSLGETEETDVLIRHPEANVMDATRVQCKRRKTVASYLTCDDADVVVTRQDRDDNLAVVPLSLFLDLLTAARDDG